MIDSDYDDLFDRIRGNLGEHFSNYMFIVMDDDGDLFYDYSNHRVGRMLVSRNPKRYGRPYGWPGYCMGNRRRGGS